MAKIRSATKRHKGHKKRTRCREIKGCFKLADSQRPFDLDSGSILMICKSGFPIRVFSFCVSCVFSWPKFVLPRKGTKATKRGRVVGRLKGALSLRIHRTFLSRFRLDLDDMHDWIPDESIFFLCLLWLFVAKIRSATKRHKGHKKRTRCREIKGCFKLADSQRPFDLDSGSILMIRMNWISDTVLSFCVSCGFRGQNSFCHEKAQRPQKEDAL